MARLALLLATVVWGATFVVVERALDDLPVFHLLAYRFALGALLLVPLARRRRRGVAVDPVDPVDPAADRKALLRDGLLVGVALFAGYAFQTGGLLTTTPSRSAFLTGLSVLLVPAFGWVAGTARPRPLSLLGAACAVAGLWVLFQPSAGGAPFAVGDALTVGCAAAFAVHVLLVEKAVRRHPVVPLAVLQFSVVAALSAPALLLDPPTARQLTVTAVAAVAITGVFATALGFVCQLYAQRRLGAMETAVLLTLEPVVAAALSIAIGREAATSGLLAGGGLILVGMLFADLGGPPPEPPGAAAPRA
jgi:drug/metabolite transporter (DMT)-like permease